MAVAKAGRVISSRNLQRLRAIQEALKDILDNAGADADDVLNAVSTRKGASRAFIIHKARDGLRYVGLITSNAYVDRDNEIVSEKALRSWVESAWQGGSYIADNPLLFWHGGPAIGDVIWSDMRGSFLIEIAKERRNPFAKLIFNLVERMPIQWGVSHGFKDKAHEFVGRWKVYRRIAKKETSILPLVFAANAFTQVKVKNMGTMDKFRLSFLKKNAPEAAALERSLTRTARRKQQQLDRAGVERKGRRTGNRASNKQQEKQIASKQRRQQVPDDELDEDEFEDDVADEDDETDEEKALDVQTLGEGLVSMVEELLTEAGADVPDDLEERLMALIEAASTDGEMASDDEDDEDDEPVKRRAPSKSSSRRVQQKQTELLETLLEDLEVLEDLSEEVKSLKPLTKLPKTVQMFEKRLRNVERALRGGPRAASEDDDSEIEQDEDDEFQRNIRRQKNQTRSDGMFADLYDDGDSEGTGDE